MTCALRALTLCDGQRLEVEPSRTEACLCWAIDHWESEGYSAMSGFMRDARQELIERTMAAPQQRS